MLCTNFDGSEKLKPMLIGRYKSPRSFKNFNYNKFIDYAYNKSCWMNSKIFNEWLSKFNIKMTCEKRKILLLLDNCPAHTPSRHYSNIELMFLPPNSSGYIQPLDQGIIASFKSYFNCYKLNFVTELVESDKMSVYDAYKNINIKNVILFTYSAWNSVKKSTISNGFNKLKSSSKKQSENFLESSDDTYTFVKDFVIKNKIIDPLNVTEFNQIGFNENDSLVAEDEFEENEEVHEVIENIVRNKMEIDEFKIHLKKIKSYLMENDSVTENFILLEQVMKYEEKINKKLSNKKGITQYFEKMGKID